MSRIINVGLIGYGMSGQLFQAPIVNAVSGLRLTKIVERHSEESKMRYPWVEVVKDAEEIFNDESIELVIISLPNKLHFEMARKALNAGKNVVVEKPFTITSGEAKELIELARIRGKLLSVYQNRRFDGDFLTVKKIVEGGTLGRLVEYEAHYDRYMNRLKPKPWKESEELGMGVLYDLGSHLIDQALTLFGTPVSIIADIRAQRDVGQNVDNFELILEYDRLKVTLKAGMVVREQGPRFMLHGTSGSFVKYGIDPQEELLKKGLSPLELLDWGTEGEESWGILNTDFNGLHYKGKVETIKGDYTLYYQNIYNALVHDKELIVKPEEALNNIRVIELAMLSSLEGRKIDFS